MDLEEIDRMAEDAEAEMNKLGGGNVAEDAIGEEEEEEEDEEEEDEDEDEDEEGEEDGE